MKVRSKVLLVALSAGAVAATAAAQQAGSGPHGQRGRHKGRPQVEQQRPQVEQQRPQLPPPAAQQFRGHPGMQQRGQASQQFRGPKGMKQRGQAPQQFQGRQGPQQRGQASQQFRGPKGMQQRGQAPQQFRGQRGPQRQGQSPMQAEILKRFDRDGDRRLSKKERTVAKQTVGKRRRQLGGSQGQPQCGQAPQQFRGRQEILKRFDRDGDGQLGEQERAALKQQVEKHQQPFMGEREPKTEQGAPKKAPHKPTKGKGARGGKGKSSK